MNHEQVMAWGNKLKATIEIQARIIRDPGALPEQVEHVKARGKENADRLDKLADLLDADCQRCGHKKASHTRGRAACEYKDPEDTPCYCREWMVEES